MRILQLNLALKYRCSISHYGVKVKLLNFYSSFTGLRLVSVKKSRFSRRPEREFFTSERSEFEKLGEKTKDFSWRISGRQFGSTFAAKGGTENIYFTLENSLFGILT